MGIDPTGAFEAARRHPWRSLLILLLVVAAALQLYFRARIGFFLDDWYLVLLRDGPADWLLPHNEHIIILPAAIYEFSLSLFGMNALPLHLVALGLFLISVALLFSWMRPLVGEAAAVLGSAIVLFLGAAAGDLLFAFQIGFFGSAVGGLGALILLRHQEARSDLLACLLFVFATLCSTLVAPFMAAAAVELLYRRSNGPNFRQLLRSAWILAVPVAIYLAWMIGFNDEGSQAASLENALRLPLYVLSAFGFAAASLTGAFPLRDVVDNYLWAIPGALLALAFAWFLRRRGKVPPAFLVGLAAGLGFWALCALNYTPARDFFTSRYQYPSVIFLLMMVAGACQGLRPDRRQLKWLGGLAVVSVILNVAVLFYAYSNVYKPHAEENLTNLAAIDLAWETVDPDFRVGIGTDGAGQISARSYKDAVGRYGRPDIGDETLTGASAEHRSELDQLLVMALPVRPLPVAGLTPRRDRCRTLTADQSASDTMPVDSTLLYIEAEQQVVIQLGRYGPGATATAWVAPAGRPIGYEIPADRSGEPWRIGFKGSGKVRVCPAGRA